MVFLPYQTQGGGVGGGVCIKQMIKHTKFSKKNISHLEKEDKPCSKCNLETLWPRTQRPPFQGLEADC